MKRLVNLGQVALFTVCVIVSGTAANLFSRHKLVPPKRELIEPDSYHGSAYFRQLLNHSNPSEGHFQQRYLWSNRWWKGPGSPIVLTTPGEESLEGYNYFLTNESIFGLFAQATGAAVVVIEHRYWGRSSPVENLETKNMKYLTLENSIADLVHFAQTVQLPFAKKSSTHPSHVPWILSGGSYAGALAAWTASTSPGTFWAYHASSAVVESIRDFWGYTWIVQHLSMPTTCKNNVLLAVSKINEVLEHGSAKAKAELKTLFALDHVEHSVDFASAIATPMYWQFGPNHALCNDMERGHPREPQSSDPVIQGSNHRQDRALAGYAAFYRKMGTTCPPGKAYGQRGTQWCLNSFNKSSSLYTDVSINNPWDRQFVWMLCNEPFGWWQAAAPQGSSILSSLVTAHYSQRACKLYFPEQDGVEPNSVRGVTEKAVNKYTQGWFPQPRKRLMWANHQLDPWRAATISSPFRPGGPRKSSPNEPVRITAGGYHCQDLLVPPHLDKTALANATRQIQAEEVAQMKKWVFEFY